MTNENTFITTDEVDPDLKRYQYYKNIFLFNNFHAFHVLLWPC